MYYELNIFLNKAPALYLFGAETLCKTTTILSVKVSKYLTIQRYFIHQKLYALWLLMFLCASCGGAWVVVCCYCSTLSQHIQHIIQGAIKSWISQYTFFDIPAAALPIYKYQATLYLVKSLMLYYRKHTWDVHPSATAGCPLNNANPPNTNAQWWQDPLFEVCNDVR